jgi:RHS repeat-associated protein
MYLPELKLYHYRARVYNPDIGRFLQVDPVGYVDQINMYAYVGNDPLNNTDPSGMKCVGTGDKSACTIDQINIARSGRKANWVSREDGLKSGKISEKKLAKLEGSLTKAYKAAQKLGNGSVTIKGSQKHGIGDITITGNEVTEALGSATLRANNHEDRVGANESTAWTDRDNETITFNTKAFNRTTDSQSRTALHESFHLIDSTRVWKEPVYLRFPHQAPFNDAAQDILDF